MITKFGSLYAGHVDLDNLGLDGTPVNDRGLSASARPPCASSLIKRLSRS